jgi:hypothetical protein
MYGDGVRTPGGPGGAYEVARTKVLSINMPVDVYAYRQVAPSFRHDRTFTVGRGHAQIGQPCAADGRLCPCTSCPA